MSVGVVSVGGMFDGVVAELDADAALAAAVELRATADRAEARLLEVAAHFADLHHEPCPGWNGRWFMGVRGVLRWRSSPRSNWALRWG